MSGKRSKSSDRWLKRQRRDYFVQQAHSQGQVSRAHFKLEQIDAKFKLIRGNSTILELGAAPGGWTNYLESRLSKGMLIAVDPLPVSAGGQTQVIEGLAGTEVVDQAIEALLNGQGLDLVLSDMAPNMSGVRAIDQARSMELADVSLAACRRWLKPGGALALKAFQGEGLEQWVTARRAEFSNVTLTKPKASRPESREIFVVARGYTGQRDDVGGLV